MPISNAAFQFFKALGMVPRNRLNTVCLSFSPALIYLHIKWMINQMKMLELRL